MEKNFNKNIFIKNNNDNDNNDINLSDEFNNLIKNNNEIIKNSSNNEMNKDTIIKINNNDDIDNINSIYFQVNNVLNKSKVNNITGEIISFKISDVNAYITIKNNDHQVNCIFWKITSSLKFLEYKKINDGDNVKIIGYFSISKKNLNIFFTIKDIIKTGIGNYLYHYQEYKNKIIELKWNLNKLILINFPYNIGIITALEGAAIQDILQSFRLDSFIGKIYIKNAIVQGSSCPLSIINSINYFELNYADKLDVLLITRGGGSYEDLVGFSNWSLLEKIYNTPFITISAIGHQIDNQLADDVSDYFFATPSLASKFLIEKQKKTMNILNLIKDKINNIKINYNKSKKYYNIIENNYEKIITNYEYKDIKNYLLKINNKIKLVLSRLNSSKNLFYNNLANIKPTIFKDKEITSINDLIDIKTGKENNPKKIEIIFIDGRIKLYYKVIEHELYK